MSGRDKKKAAEKPQQLTPGGFVRKTITIPGELFPFAEDQTNRPEHAGNLSSYVRSLILDDRRKKLAEFQPQAA